MRENHRTRAHTPRLVTLSLLALLQASGTPTPSAAQIADAVFSTERPDAHAPAGVGGDRILERGSFQFGYRFANLHLDGLRDGREPISGERLLETYSIVPQTRTTLLHEIDVRYGLREGVTVRAVLPYLDLETGNLTGAGAFFTHTSGIGDVLLEGLVSLFGQGAARAHLNLGLSMPTGAIDALGRTPLAPAGATLPYQMQPGSGSWVFHPGATVMVQNEQGSVGAQLLGALHLNENRRGYRRGDRVSASVWLSPRINDYLSLSGRVTYENYDRVRGADPTLDPGLDPTQDPAFQGGERIELPVGLNIFLAEGPFAGHRLSVEVTFATRQDNDGIQLEGDRSFSIRWIKTF